MQGNALNLKSLKHWVVYECQQDPLALPGAALQTRTERAMSAVQFSAAQCEPPDTGWTSKHQASTGNINGFGTLARIGGENWNFLVLGGVN